MAIKRPVAGEVERRHAPDLLGADEKKIRGKIPYGVESRDLGGWREVIEPGALNSARLDDLVVTVDHTGVPLGRYPTTLDLEDRLDALHWSVSPPESRGEVREAVERGDLRGGSWRMVVGRDEWRGDVRHVHEITDLLDVSIVTTGAYPADAASVELRSNPDPATSQEDTTMADEAEKDTTGATEDRSVRVTHEPDPDPKPQGGLKVEERKIEKAAKSFVDEIADFSRDVKRGETRALSTSSSLSNAEYSVSFFDALRSQSAFIASGVQTLSTESDSVIYPIVTGDPTIGWVAEAGTITPSDPTLGSGTATPHKLSVIVRYSNELSEDSSPELESVLRQVLLGRAAVSLDVAAFQGAGGDAPTGMGALTGIGGTVDASGAATSIAWALNAAGTLEALNAPRPYAIAGPAALARHIRGVRVDTGGTVGPYLFSPTSGGLPEIWGMQPYINSSLSAGTLHAYSPSACYLVNRTQGFDIEVDRSRLFNSDESEMRLRARVDVLFPYKSAVCRGTGVPA